MMDGRAAQSTYDAVAWCLIHGPGLNDFCRTRLGQFSDQQLKDLIAALYHHHADPVLVADIEGLL
jgi:hypothetical protein